MTTIEYRGKDSEQVGKLEKDIQLLYSHFNLVSSGNDRIIVKGESFYDVEIIPTNYNISIGRFEDNDGTLVLKDGVKNAYISTIGNNIANIKIDDKKYGVRLSPEKQ